MIAQPLVIEHELPNFARELLALPMAFPATGLLAFILWCSGLHRPYRIGRGA